MKWLAFICVLFVICLPSAAWAQTPEIVQVAYVPSEAAVRALAEGGIGEALIMYTTAERGPEQPSLIVRLRHSGVSAAAEADVFDAAPGTQAAPFERDGDQIRVPDTAVPAVSLRAADGWWVRGTQINYNLDIQVRGPVYAMWGGSDPASATPASWTSQIKVGQPAVDIMVRDEHAEGLPRWELRQLLPEFPNKGFYRTNYAERTCSAMPKRDLGVSPIWPFVASRALYEQTTGTLAPPIGVDWAHAKLTHFGELVTVRNQACSYASYSVSPLKLGQQNQLDFETPFAFYDLADAGGDMPNLVIRTEHFPANDPWSVGLDPKVQRGQPVPYDFTTMRYSWRNAPGDNLWDYKVDVYGSRPYSTTTPIAGGQATIDAPGYAELPTWVIGQSWPAVSFVDTEGTSYLSSEGIYDWSPVSAGVDYLLGWSTMSRPTAFALQDLSDGFRGEYRLKRDLPPRLYWSGLDGRLHLYGAEAGLLKLSDGLVLRQGVLGNSPYLNYWQLERLGRSHANEGTVEAQLFALNGYLLYADRTGVVLRKAHYQLADFEIAPPTDKASWQEFREQLASTIPRRDAHDLQGWMSAMPGISQTLNAAAISDVQATANGFQFTLTLDERISEQGAPLVAVSSLQPGAYRIVFDGAFAVSPLSQAHPSGTLENKSVAALVQHDASVLLRNDGATSMTNAELQLWAAAPAHPATLVATRTLDLPASSVLTTTLRWAPNRAGDWHLQLRLRDTANQNVLLADETVHVQSGSTIENNALIATSANGALIGVLVALALGVALIIAFVSQQFWPAADGGTPHGE